MKKNLITIVLVLVGCGLWLALSQSARFSIKKWDAKFGTALRHHMQEVGLSDRNLLSRTHEVQKDDAGEWVIQKITIDELGKEKISQLKSRMEKTGAHIEQVIRDGDRVLLVKRGKRVYQEIRIKNVL